MRWHPHGYGGRRRDPEQVKREGWREQGVLAVSADDDRLTWPERELVRQLGEKLYGPRPSDREARHGRALARDVNAGRSVYESRGILML
ncbi:MAG: hypothetical protein M9945_08035 [Aquamicrobium sp.]|nr:hypothetical protein [Aquamicrobium sp.]